MFEKKITTILIVVTLSFIVLLLFFNFKFEWGKNESTSTALDIVMVATAIMGVIGIVLQLGREKSLKEIEFIVDFNRNFVEYDELMSVHDICSEQAGLFVDGHNKDRPLDHTSVYKYLDCFEPLYFLLKSKAVGTDKLYDLVSYRFFIVLNNREVQEKIIAVHKSSYKNIIEMYKILNGHRKKNKLPTPFPTFEQNDLLKFLTSYENSCFQSQN
jgi:hypothetical protein